MEVQPPWLLEILSSPEALLHQLVEPLCQFIQVLLAYMSMESHILFPLLRHPMSPQFQLPL